VHSGSKGLKRPGVRAEYVNVKILVVDDSNMMRAMVKRTLVQAGFGGHDVSEAVDGADALSQFGGGGPDIVLSDWNMPNMSGLELLSALRAGGNAVPFVFVTSEGTAEMRASAEKEGAIVVIEKPFTPEAFKSALGSIIS
jgi:two-component system chemotaxis response regulator CheY